MKVELRGEDYYVDGVKKEHRVSKVLKVTRQCDDYTSVDPYYRDLGIATALAIKFDLSGNLDESSVDADVKPRLEAWRTFVRETDYKPIHCELSLYSPSMDICGTPDHYGILSRKPGILDTKCTKLPKKWWKKQLHFYRRLIDENKIGPVEWIKALMLKPDATYEVEEFSLEPENLVDCIMGLYRNELLEDKRRKHE